MPRRNSSQNCKFYSRYVDGTTAAGVIATEKLTFETSDEGTTSVSDIVFGCANEFSSVVPEGQSNGIVGLGNGELSLATQMDSKFSYCIGRLNAPHNHLILGDGAKVEGPSTPVEFFNGLYHLKLDGITLGDKKLAIDPILFRRTPSGNRGVIIDSGTPFTFLPRSAFEPLSSEVQRLMDNALLPRVDRLGFPTPCFKGAIDRDLSGFPIVSFNFAGGVDLSLDAKSMFFEDVPNQFCMAVIPAAYVW